MMQNIALENGRTAHVIYNLNINGKSYATTESPWDLQIDIEFHYPHSTLTVDDNVLITAIAVARDNIINITNSDGTNGTFLQFIRHVVIYFENSLSPKATIDSNNILNNSEADLHMFRTTDPAHFHNLYYNTAHNLYGNTTVYWPIEGQFRPYLTIEYFNLTIFNLTNLYNMTKEESQSFLIRNLVIKDLGLVDIPVIVYSKADSAQLVSNQASIVSSIAILALTSVGTLGIIFYLWDWKPQSQQLTGRKR
jgi:hypothetical protein